MNKEKIAALLVAKLEENAAELAQQFAGETAGTSTRFFVLDDVLPENLVRQVYDGFPGDGYVFRKSFRERKFTFIALDQLPDPVVESVTDAFQDDAVIDIISRITGIADLYGDPSLYAGGISRMDQGHFLNPHIDNSHDAARQRYRRLNLLFYVTPELQESDGGSFELWDDKVRQPVKICSRFNRLVVMETTKTSWHSVDPVVSDLKRCCVSNYFFSTNSPTGPDYYHVTRFLGRPEQPFRRLWGRMDNALRQTVARLTGYSRGKALTRKVQVPAGD